MFPERFGYLARGHSTTGRAGWFRTPQEPGAENALIEEQERGGGRRETERAMKRAREERPERDAELERQRCPIGERPRAQIAAGGKPFVIASNREAAVAKQRARKRRRTHSDSSPDEQGVGSGGWVTRKGEISSATLTEH